jgi:hypothetical protein
MSQKVYTGAVPLVGGAATLPEPRPEPASAPLRPLYLLADSQLLFWTGDDGVPFAVRLREGIGAPVPLAAYVGASNGDEPAYYDLFLAAMDSAGITECRMVPVHPSPDDLSFLGSADLVLLAGGDVERGWRAMEANGVRETVVRRYHAGAVIVGVSAGAVQLGTHGWPEGNAAPGALFPTFALVPFVVSAHDEGAEWGELRLAVSALGGAARGVGIPAGGGVVYHPDHTVEAVRRPAAELELRAGEVAATLLFPPQAARGG